MLIKLHGTYDLPSHMRNGGREYNGNYNRVHNRVGKAGVAYDYVEDEDLDNYLNDIHTDAFNYVQY